MLHYTAPASPPAQAGPPENWAFSMSADLQPPLQRSRKRLPVTVLLPRRRCPGVPSRRLASSRRPLSQIAEAVEITRVCAGFQGVERGAAEDANAGS